MYAIFLNQKHEEIGMFQNYARRQYATLQKISRTIEGTLKIERIGGRDEWRLLWSADYREIGRVRKVEAPPAVVEPRPVRLRELATSAVLALLAVVGLGR